MEIDGVTPLMKSYKTWNRIKHSVTKNYYQKKTIGYK